MLEIKYGNTRENIIDFDNCNGRFLGSFQVLHLMQILIELEPSPI